MRMSSFQKHFFVIVNYNSGHHIISTIQSIFSSKNITPNIIIVDNHSTDNSLEYCKTKFPHITYISCKKNVGFASGANIGMRYACKNNAETITLINPDATIDPYCMHHIFQKIQKIGPSIASPIIFNDETKSEIWFSGGKIHSICMRATHKSPKNTLLEILPKNSFISGCVMTISRKIIDEIGFFDEQFFLYYEDVDLSLRAQKKNFTLCVVKNAYAYHKELSENMPQTKIYHLVLSGALFFSKHASIIQKPYFATHIFLRKIKNYYDRKRHAPFSKTVHKALNDLKKHL
ncbi:MAG: hypothetical protein CR972_00560 [Candidatus Moraniibacteriota bacterium]|nr:MAG: hypothetical protein CR972_00560 [Candidatus Moranbacteria bacterium]